MRGKISNGTKSRMKKLWAFVLALLMIVCQFPTNAIEVVQAASASDRLYHIDLKVDATVTYDVYVDGKLTKYTVDDATVSDVSMYYTDANGTKTYIYLSNPTIDKSNNYYEYFMYGWSKDPDTVINDSSDNRERYRKSGEFYYGNTVTISYTMTHTNPITGKTVVGTHETTQTLTIDTNVCSEINNSDNSRGFDAYVVHSHVDETVSNTDLTVTKVWDKNSYDISLPENITVAIKTNNQYAANVLKPEPAAKTENSDGTYTYEVTLTPSIMTNNGDGSYSYTFADLPIGERNGNEWTAFTYELVGETKVGTLSVSDRTAKIDDSSWWEVTLDTTTNTMTNKYNKLETANFVVNKIWDTSSNPEIDIPNSITVQLLQNGFVYGNPVTINPDKGVWTYTYTNLPKYDVNGKAYTYTISESTVEDFTTKYRYIEDGSGVVITNTADPVYTNITAKKEWLPELDSDSDISVTFHLMKNGKHAGENFKKELNNQNNWEVTWENLPVYENGEKINYTILEESADIPEEYTVGYRYEDDVYIVTNTYNPNHTSLVIEKVWKDADNQDGIRPKEVQVQLYRQVGEEGTPEKVDDYSYKDSKGNEISVKTTITLSEDNHWAYSFNGLDKTNKEGKEYIYTAREVEIPQGYEVSYITDKLTGEFQIINTHTPETIDVSVNKVWDDANNQDGIRPESIQIGLYADGTYKDGALVKSDKDGNWSYKFTNLPKYANGKEIQYTITEGTIIGYEVSIEGVAEGFTITNTHIPETTSVSVNKVWDDANNQDGIRPNSVTVTLYKDGEKTDQTATLSESNSWSTKFDNLPKYANGTAISYSIKEEAVDGYTSNITGEQQYGYTITNSHTPETTDIYLVKIWDDANNQDGVRPATIKVILYKTIGETTETVETQEFTVSESETHVYGFYDLPKYENGVQIQYSIKEGEVKNYSETYTYPDDNPTTSDIKEGVVHIINTHTPEATSVFVEKLWEDKDNQDGKRPDTINVRLYADGVATDKTATLNEDNDWEYTFGNLDKYSAGSKIIYTVIEENIPDGYSVGYVRDENTGNCTITNTYTPEQTSVTVSKAWDDADNQDGLRDNIQAIVVTLYADGVATDKTVELTRENASTATFTELDKYKDGGDEIEYTVKETALKLFNEITVEGDDKIKEYGYTPSVTGNASSGYTITNSHTPETIDITAKKVWEDNGYLEVVHPEVKFHLTANGEHMGEKYVKTISKGATGDALTVTWEDLPKYEDGEEINYLVFEEQTKALVNYETDYSYDRENGVYVVTNIYDPNHTSLVVEKEWNDANNQDGIRPDSVMVQLYKDGIKVESYKYTDASGNEITVMGEQTLSAENHWEYSYNGLDKIKDGTTDKLHEYTVMEVSIPTGYNVSYETDELTRAYEIINTHTPETTEVTVNKKWDDANNQDGIRPASVEIELYADGVATGKTAILNSENTWSYTFEGLALNSNGTPVVYTVREVAVPDGYEVSYEKDDNNVCIITNTHSPETITIPVMKLWDDDNDKDGLRAKIESITVELLANGEKTGKTLELTRMHNVSAAFENLPKYKDGKEIEYIVEEIKINTFDPEVEIILGDLHTGYLPTYEGTYDSEEGIKITNVHHSETIDIPVVKVWDDANNQDGKRPTSVTVQVFANGMPTNTTAVLSEDNNWRVIFEDLYKYDVGVEIEYTVKEVSLNYADGNTVLVTEENKADEYIVDVQSVDGVVYVTNTYISGTAELTITKTQAVGNEMAPTTTKTEVKAGDIVTYYITVTNKAESVVSEAFTITDQIPAGLTLVEDSISHDGTVDENGLITWNMDALGGNDSVIVSFQVVVPKVEETTKWKNIATLVVEEKETDSNEVEIEENIPDEETPDVPTDNTNPPATTPKTGDLADPFRWASVLLIGTAMMGSAVLFNGKKKEENEK